jgi:hypothetical protein
LKKKGKAPNNVAISILSGRNSKDVFSKDGLFDVLPVEGCADRHRAFDSELYGLCILKRPARHAAELKKDYRATPIRGADNGRVEHNHEMRCYAGFCQNLEKMPRRNPVCEKTLNTSTGTQVEVATRILRKVPHHGPEGMWPVTANAQNLVDSASSEFLLPLVKDTKLEHHC